jgi:hypothetical protein
MEEILGGNLVLLLLALPRTESSRSRTHEGRSFERSFGFFR